jgi:hypothetical protein
MSDDMKIKIIERMEDQLEIVVTRRSLRSAFEYSKEPNSEAALRLFDAGAPVKVTVE